MLSIATRRSYLSVNRLDLSDRCPLSGADPGAFKSVLYGMFPAADLYFEEAPFAEVVRKLIEEINASGYRFVLLDLDKHAWLARKPGLLAELAATLRKRGARLQAFGAKNAMHHLISPNREAAIAACISDWEQALLKNFSW